MENLIFCASVQFFSGRHLEMSEAFKQKFGETLVSSSHEDGILFVWTKEMLPSFKKEIESLSKSHDIKLGITTFREVC